MTDPFTIMSKADPHFLAEMEDDPLLAVRWRKAIGAKMRDISASSTGGGSDAPRGGRFAYRLDAKQRVGLSLIHI